MTPDMAIGILLGLVLAAVLMLLCWAVVAIVDYDNRERAEQLSSRAIEVVERPKLAAHMAWVNSPPPEREAVSGS